MIPRLKVKPETITEFVTRAALSGILTKREILEAVHANFPESRTTMTTINWYIKHLRRAWYKNPQRQIEQYPLYLGRQTSAQVVPFKKK